MDGTPEVVVIFRVRTGDAGICKGHIEKSEEPGLFEKGEGMLPSDFAGDFIPVPRWCGGAGKI